MMPARYPISIVLVSCLVIAGCSGEGSSSGQSSPKGNDPPTGDTQAPTITIEYPANGSSLAFRVLGVVGSVDDSTASITVNEAPTTNDAGSFEHEVLLTAGTNSIDVTATDPFGNSTTKSVDVIWDSIGAVVVDNSIQQSVDNSGTRLEIPTVAAVEIGPDTANFPVTVSAVRLQAIEDEVVASGLGLHGSQPGLRIHAADYFADTIGIIFEIPDLNDIANAGLAVDLAIFQLVGSDLEGIQADLTTIGAIPCDNGNAICARVSPGSFMPFDPFDESEIQLPTLILVPVTYQIDPAPAPVTEGIQLLKIRSDHPNWRIWADIGPIDEVEGLPVVSVPVNEKAANSGQVDVKFQFRIEPNIQLTANPLAQMAENSPYGRRNSGIGLHWGVDYKASNGTEVRAMHSGRVDLAGSLTGTCGLLKQIGSAKDWWSRNCHLSDQMGGDGGLVNSGDVIALSGDTGKNKAGKRYPPHLHIDLPILVAVKFTDGRIDPRPFLPGSNSVDILRPWTNAENQDLPARIELLKNEKRIGNGFSLTINSEQEISITVPLNEAPGWNLTPDGVALEAIVMAPRLAMNQRQFVLGKVQIKPEERYVLYKLDGIDPPNVNGTETFFVFPEWVTIDRTITSTDRDGNTTTTESTRETFLTGINYIQPDGRNYRQVCRAPDGTWVPQYLTNERIEDTPYEGDGESGQSVLTYSSSFRLDADGTASYTSGFIKDQDFVNTTETFGVETIITRIVDTTIDETYSINIDDAGVGWHYDRRTETDYSNNYDESDPNYSEQIHSDWRTTSIDIENADYVWPAGGQEFETMASLTLLESFRPGEALPAECLRDPL